MKQLHRPRSGESGYALLMVFVLAAVVAITLYMEMPRVAFESQRTKEQLLIDRGEQYKRAIQVFYRKNKRFPATMDELEKYQEIRFLRQRYKDPMTGKDEWRIIHVGPGGQLTDSLVKKQQNPLGPNGQNGQNGQQASNGQQGANGQQQGSSDSSNPGFGSGFGSQASNGQANGQPVQYNANGIPITGADSSGAPATGINMAVARRHSDQMNLGGQGQPGAVNPGDPNDPNQPQDGNQPVDPNQAQNVAQQNPGQPNPNQPNPGPSRYPGQVYPGQPQPGQPYLPGVPGQPGFPPGFQQPGQQQANGQPYNPNLPYNPNQQNPGAQQQQSSFNNGGNSFNNGSNNGNNGSSFGNGAQNNPALNAVQNSLFAPRPQGAGFNSNSASGNSPGGAVGIAGVATKYKGPSIKIVNERKKYQEWEFVYDMKKDKSLLGAAGVNALQNGQNPGQGQNAPGFSSFGGNQNSNGSSFGNNSGSSFGNNSGSSFGSGSQSQGQSQGQSQPQPQQQPQQ